MSAEESPISYRQLRDLEDDFEDVDLEMSRFYFFPLWDQKTKEQCANSLKFVIVRQQDKLTKDLYAKREKLVAQIPDFWPLVFTQAPADIDELIQPTDSTVLVNSLTSLSVERIELPHGDPRSVSIKFGFAENEYFEDKIIEKKFYWRYSKGGWEGLISEPVSIKWKSAEKDLTGGMLDLVVKIWEEEKAGKGEGEETEAKKALTEKMENTGLGGVSFFAFFAFCGRHITDEESNAALKARQEKRQLAKDGKDVDEDDEDEEEEDDFDEYEFEIFPAASDAAHSIVDDLWPNATRYFSKQFRKPLPTNQDNNISNQIISIVDAQEFAAMSDIEFEDGSDEEMEDDEEADEHQDKKRKA